MLLVEERFMIEVDSKQARQSVDYNYQQLDPRFLKAMAQIGHYGAEKYGVGSWKKKELTGDADPINHAYEHIGAFLSGDEHDKFGDTEWNLVAAAYNLMMAWTYARQNKLSLNKPLDIQK